MEPPECLSNDEPSPLGSLRHLDSQGAKKVLEIYVKRSLSDCEAKTRGYLITPVDLSNRRTETKKWRKVQRSMSDFGKYQGRRNMEVPLDKSKPQSRTGIKAKNADDRNDQTELSQREVVVENGSTTGKSIHKVKQGKGQQSWLKTLLSFFTKRKDDEPIDILKTMPTDSNGNHIYGCEEQGSSVDLCTSCQGLVKSNKKKSSLKKAFSFKKNATEVEKRPSLKETGRKSMRPNHLPLHQVNRPRTEGDRNNDFYYSSVSAEIEQIVKQNDDNEGRLRLGSSQEDLGYEEKELLIRKIASMLQKKGDEWDKKIKDDPTLNTFFKEMSYSSFKQLADIYVDKEVKKKKVDVTPEEVKFAFTVHFTAKVAGVCPHPVSRIMGFGNQYLEDSCAQLSYRRKCWDKNADEKEECQSPD
ncbi:protein BNIP5-like [Pleurodeles waltl]